MGASRTRRLELAGYLLVALGLLVLLAVHLRRVDGYYLDEWMYTHGAEYMWDHPSSIWGQIPNWTRGPQRLYSLLLAPFWGPLGTSAAYTASHLLNALLLVSSVIPAALLARRVIEAPLLRVLAVAVAVAVPWLVISANQLTENLALPVLMWSVLLISWAAEKPTWLSQIAAMGAVLALALTRLNLAVIAGVLVLAVLVDEVLRRGEGGIGGVARRRAPLLVAGVLAALAVLARGGLDLGAYGVVGDENFFKSKWILRDAIVTNLALYTRGLVTGTFVLPFVLGVAGAVAGIRGVLGPRARMPALVALAGAAALLLVVATWTVNVVYEERYVFYAFPPLAVFAVAAVPHARRMLPELGVASLLAVVVLSRGTPVAGGVSYDFFAAPGAAFWARVVDYRLVLVDRNVLGWVPGADLAWHAVAAGLVVLLAVVLVARFRRRWRLDLALAGALAVCCMAQVLALDYDFGRLLDGTPQAPGGLALAPGHALDRDAFVDRSLASGSAVLIPPPLFPRPLGTPERVEFWNRRIDGVMALRFLPVGVPAPAGYGVVETPLENGLAAPQQRVDHVVSQVGDPRVQFSGRELGRSKVDPLLVQTVDRPRAIWTSTGLDSDLYVTPGQRPEMTLDRAAARDVRAVVLRLRAAQPLDGRVRFRISGNGASAAGALRAGAERDVRVAVPPCGASTCAPLTWRLSASGATTPLPTPDYGPTAPRDVGLQVLSATLERG